VHGTNAKSVLLGYTCVAQFLATCTSQCADYRWGHLK